MAIKSIVDIEINDTQLKAYAARTKKHFDDLKASAREWKKIEAEIKKADAAQKSVVDSVTKISSLSRLSSATDKVSTQFHERSAIAWQKIAIQTRLFATNIYNVTRQLLRWASITGVVTGLLGGGGLFGISRLAQSAAGQRRSSLGLGVTNGQQTAFRTYYSPYVDTEGVMGGVNTARTSMSDRWRFAQLGIGNVEGKGTAQLSIEVVEALKRIADRTPTGQLGDISKTLGLDFWNADATTLQNLKRRGADEISGARTGYNKDVQSLTNSDENLRKWENFNRQLDLASGQIKAAFVDVLTPLTPDMEELSKAFSKLMRSLLGGQNGKDMVKGLQEGIEWLTAKINSGEFQTGVNNFIHNVILMGEAIARAIGWMLPKADRTAIGGDQDWMFPAGQAGPRAMTPGQRVDAVRDKNQAWWDDTKSNWPKLVPSPIPFGKEAVGIGSEAVGAFLEALKRYHFWVQKQTGTGTPEALPMSGTGNAKSMVVPIDFRPPGAAGTGGGTGGDWDSGGGGGRRGSAGPVGPTGTPGAGAAGPGGIFARLEGEGGLPTGLLDAIWNRETHRGIGRIRGTSGEIGPMQFMPGTWKRFGQGDQGSLADSAEAAKKYFQFLMQRFHGDVAKAIAGYNAGEGRVDAAVAKWGDRWREHIPASTRGYLQDVLPHVGGTRIQIHNNTGGNAIVTAAALRA